MKIPQSSSIHPQSRFTLDASRFKTVTIAALSWTLGSVNFDMRRFRLQVTGPKAIARTPELAHATGPRPVTLDATRIRFIVLWQGTKVQNILGLDEVSVA